MVHNERHFFFFSCQHHAIAAFKEVALSDVDPTIALVGTKDAIIPIYAITFIGDLERVAEDISSIAIAFKVGDPEDVAYYANDAFRHSSYPHDNDGGAARHSKFG
jgi:hypothetical protein